MLGLNEILDQLAVATVLWWYVVMVMCFETLRLWPYC